MVITSVNKNCKLKLDINRGIINKIFQNLQQKVEVAGYFDCDNYNNVVNVKQQNGNADSVYTPNNVINFHTHPVSAYRAASCVWGWPSGEDIRESIKFGLAGNKAHLVFTNEGLYTIQVSPCKLIKLKGLNDAERCVLIFAIEEYFKTTHEFRGTDEVNDLEKNGIFINPYSFIDLVNTFNLSNLEKTVNKSYSKLPIVPITKVGHTGIHYQKGNTDNLIKYAGFGLENQTFSKIPIDGLPQVNGTKVCTKQFCKVINKDDLDTLRVINCTGQEKDIIEFKGINDYLKQLQAIIVKFNEQPCSAEWNNDKIPDAWFYINFFPSNKYRQGLYKNQKGKYTVPCTGPVMLDTDPFIRIFSNEKTGCSVNKIKQTNNFN